MVESSSGVGGDVARPCHPGRCFDPSFGRHCQVWCTSCYRLSVRRQQLQIDTRPNLDSIKTFAELLQAETEEHALRAEGVGGAGKTTVPFVKAAALGTSSTTATSAMVNAQESKAAGVESKGDCCFWLSEKSMQAQAFQPQPKRRSVLLLFRPQSHAA